MDSGSYGRRALLLGVVALLVTACGEKVSQAPTDPGTRSQPAEVAEGVDLSMAIRIHNAHTPDLMDIEGVVGTALAVDGENPRIRVYTMHGAVRGVPTHVEGIPVERVVTGMFYADNANDPTTFARPAPNGFSIGHPNITAGTLGAVVRDDDDVCYALSNNHVLADINKASIGDNALQPGPFDGGSNPTDAIASLSDFEPIAFNGSSNTIDAAIAALFNPDDVTGATPGYAYGAPGTDPVSAGLEMDVEKFGRTTGYTTGTIKETNVTVDVCYESRGPFRCKSLARFTDQIGIAPGNFSDGGDSGSLIVRSSDKSPVGLLYAGSSTRTLANPIGPVLSRFNVVIETNLSNCGGGGTPTNQPPTADFSYSTNLLTATFTDASSDSDGTVDTHSWDFGDSQGSNATNPSHTYTASGTYTVEFTVTDDDGDSDSVSKTVTVSDGSGFTLTVNGRKVRGRHTVDLTWSGATTGTVAIYRDGSVIATETNDGDYTDATGNRGGVTYIYQVCEAGSLTCSNVATVTF